MQAPLPDSDNNPYHVFRQRAKPNKPQTRRRRETQEESLEKLRAIHDNLSQALAIAELVREREVKKARLTVRFFSWYRIAPVFRQIFRFEPASSLRNAALPPPLYASVWQVCKGSCMPCMHAM